jgi:hypothetical protein
MECEVDLLGALQYRIRCLGLGVISGSKCPLFPDIGVRQEFDAPKLWALLIHMKLLVLLDD